MAPSTDLSTGIVHIGLSNFHRAHQAVHTAAALAAEPGPWGVLGIAPRSTAVADALVAQDLRYAVVEISPDGERASVPAVHTGALVAARDPEPVLTALAAPDTRIVSLTVTEGGYTIDPRTGGIDLDDPGVRADLAGTCSTAIGLLARGLQRRARGHGAPVTVLSCDNLLANGEVTQRLVRGFAAALPAGERDELLGYLDTVTFPNSMVDRIVPATTDATRAAAARLTGTADAVPVPAEPFSMWVLQDAFAAGRPAWEAPGEGIHGAVFTDGIPGAVFTDDVAGYELLKLRLLNGTHSLIAYLGALAGEDLIARSVARSSIRAAAGRVLHDDYRPTVRVPEGVDVDDYAGQLFTRWSNAALGHRTRQVGSDGSLKLAQRIPGPAAEHLASGVLPQHLALTVAGWLACVAPPAGFDPGPHAAAMAEPAREQLAATAAGPIAAHVRAGLELLGGEPGAGFADRTAELLDVLVRHGVDAAVAEAAGERRAP
ncbi:MULTISPECIES: mannitol dehydrogenase family protein [Pseudonocardia]|uniref:Mannitol-1-phosphate 5-dehydrogenase n=2 Tax=Pseudonocardia TaxID=1847 RepID=A0A1Y2N6G6_PSEAH|nr:MULTISPECIES: mannitol dehydrogenase family protein [Pseudonocardia]OSY42761.1 Polyol:NADP oxidoreductase [Pseudonocardia autotrophica]TDN77338.1 fructuronate reductase [Pseudonocardia autotrophica]BBG01360.1 mannitol dehydrogenase [Pseudonocardia autotrophica]GEC24416.1 mannitol dehydrogenase [Pseudonocardia saturnea]